MLAALGDGSYVYANSRAAELLGYTVTELLQCSISELVHPDELPHIMERHHRIFAGEDVSRQYEVRMIRKDGVFVPDDLQGLNPENLK